MAVNFPGPFGVEIEYTFAGFTHRMNLNCDLTTDPTPGSGLEGLNVISRAGIGDLQAAVAVFYELLRPLFGTNTQFQSWTLWKYTPLSFDRVFIGSEVIDLAGTGVSQSQASSERIITFRTQEGGVMKLYLMEDSSQPGPSVSRAAVTSSMLALVEAVEATTNWILARDTSYPVVGIAVHPGQSEVVFKKRNRTL